MSFVDSSVILNTSCNAQCQATTALKPILDIQRDLFGGEEHDIDHNNFIKIQLDTNDKYQINPVEIVIGDLAYGDCKRSWSYNR